MIDAKAQFDKLMAKYQKVTKEIQKEFGQKSKILESQEGILKPEEFNKKKEEFEKELRQKQQELYDERQYLEKLHEKVEMTFSDNIREVIKDISKGKGYVVFDKASILYNDESIDISDVVIDGLNKRLKKIDLESEKK
jgi:Skp family chaperone for outer membrane proteins